jgi:[acyl-carrier-protein] S-malonyltransferase
MKQVALIFPGQGAQKVGMGRAFYETCDASKAVFDQADKIIDGLSEVVFNGPQEKLTLTQYCQPGIVTMSMAALAALKASDKFANMNPQYACGLSLGEYAALCACGALSLEDTLKLIERRSTYMTEATQQNQGKMAAVIGMDKATLIGICDETGAEVANFNSHEQIVITGHAEKVDAAVQKIEAVGAKRVIPLEVSGAFHSTLMQSAADKFVQELQNVTIKTPDFPIVSNVDAIATTHPPKIMANLTEQITSSVQWVDTIEMIASHGITDFIEIGPGNVLKGLLRKISREYKVHNIRTPEDIEKLEL